MFATAVGDNLCNIGPTLGEAPRSIGRPYPGPANRATALLAPPKDGVRFLEKCATPYLAVDPQFGCHGSIGEVRYA